MSDHTSGGHDESRERPGTPTCQELLERLQDRVEITRKSRHETARRIEKRGKRWDTTLVLMALTASIIATTSLVEPSIYADRGDLISAILGIVVLAVSLLVTNANYGAKSSELFRHYQNLQRVSTKIEQCVTGNSSDRVSLEEIEKLNDEYLNELGTTFNHSTADFYSSLNEEERKSRGISNKQYRSVMWRSSWISRIPLVLSGASVFGVLPFMIWIIFG
ncbi:SLATT domain-containing protein [Brevibacterium sp. FAM 24630]|uniref:SLATT domain-containing protein n=1 Tax=Brevibacterium sp. FAM 24630 TaxID=3415680 RepID=UPI003C79E7D9